MIPYQNIIGEVALRIGAVNGSTPSAKTTSLAVNPLTATQIGSVDFPLSSIQRAVLSGVARLVRAFTYSKSHPFRRYLTSQTAPIPHLGQLPSTNSGGKSIVGAYGAVKDSDTGKVLTEQPLQIVETIVGDTFLKKPYFYYAMMDGVIYHTVENVVIDVCTFDLAAEQAKLNVASSLSPLPDALFDASFAAALSILVADDDFSNQQQMYEVYTQNVVNELRGGAVEFNPAPEQVNTKGVS